MLSNVETWSGVESFAGHALMQDLSSVPSNDALLSNRLVSREIDVPDRGFKITIELSEAEANRLDPAIEKLAELLRLPSNWDTYGATMILPEAVVRAIQFIDQMIDNNTPLPSIVPTTNGGIQLEWHTRGIDIEVDLSSASAWEVFWEDHLEGSQWEGIVGQDRSEFQKIIRKLSHRL